MGAIRVNAVIKYISDLDMRQSEIVEYILGGVVWGWEVIGITLNRGYIHLLICRVDHSLLFII